MVLPLTSGTFHFFLWTPSLWSQFESSLHRRLSWRPNTFTFLLFDCTLSKTLKIHSYASCCPRVRIWLLKYPNSPVSPASAPDFLDHGWPSSLALPLCLANLGAIPAHGVFFPSLFSNLQFSASQLPTEGSEFSLANLASLFLRISHFMFVHLMRLQIPASCLSELKKNENKVCANAHMHFLDSLLTEIGV